MAHILFLSDSTVLDHVRKSRLHLESIGKGLKHFKQGSDTVRSAFSKDSVVRREDGGEIRPEAERPVIGAAAVVQVGEGGLDRVVATQVETTF